MLLLFAAVPTSVPTPVLTSAPKARKARLSVEQDVIWKSEPRNDLVNTSDRMRMDRERAASSLEMTMLKTWAN